MKRFNAKLMLFGEYGVMLGAEALAVPFPRFTGSLEFSEGADVKSSQAELEQFVSYFNHHELNRQMNYPLNLKGLQRDLEKGLYFNSDIPLQYGVGSSGALCAAIYEHYGKYRASFDVLKKKKNILSVLKKDFSVMESYFHGKSSGFDPLASFINRPVMLSGSAITLPTFSAPKAGYSVYLIDTAIQSSTSPLVRLFMQKMKNSQFEQQFNDIFIPANKLAINAFLSGNSHELFQQLKLISNFQIENMREMIPAEFQTVWRQMQDEEIFLKLLGSGGGGYLLAFVKDGTKLDADLISLKVF
jgi:mevalonate kinase